MDSHTNDMMYLRRLVIAARSADKLQETAQDCRKYTEDVHAVVADVSQEADCRTIVDTAVQKFGGVDVLILNAALSPTPKWFRDYIKPVSGNQLHANSPSALACTPCCREKSSVKYLGTLYFVIYICLYHRYSSFLFSGLICCRVCILYT